MSATGAKQPPSNGFDWRAFDAYLFDIDGTLLNSCDQVHYFAFYHALQDVYGVQRKIDGVPVHGNTDVGILRAATALAGIANGEFERKLPQALDRIRAHVAENAHELRPALCPSILRLLTELHANGKVIGVTTGNLETVGWAKLQAAGIRQYFSLGSFSDHNEFRASIFRKGADMARQLTRPDAKVCFLGDTPNDVNAAREIEMPLIAVATGKFSVDELSALGPNLCLSSCDLLWP